MGKARVYVGHIPYAARVRDIEHFFRGYGKINDISLKTGFAFVEFDQSRDAEDAVDARNGRSMLGERVLVELAKGTPRGGDVHRYDASRSRGRRDRKRSRSSGGSRDRSRGRRRRRSRSSSRKDTRSRPADRRRRSSTSSSLSLISPFVSIQISVPGSLSQKKDQQEEGESPQISFRTTSKNETMEERNEKIHGAKLTSAVKGSSDEEEPDMDEGWNDFNEEEDVIDLTKSENEEEKDEKKVTTFHDLPDELLLKIGKYVGSKNRMKLRVDKRMDERVLTLLKLDDINFRCELTFNSRTTKFSMNDGWSILRNMEPSLRRWAQFTTVQNIVIASHANTIVHVLLQFNADKLVSTTTIPRKLQQLDFASLLVMSANIREVRISHICSSVEATDLLCLRNALLDGGCKLEALTIDLKHGIRHDFIKKCFNVTIFEKFEPMQTIEYQNPPILHPVQLYAFNNDIPGNTVHFEREIKTEIEANRFSLLKVNGYTICELITVMSDIRLNHTYTYDIFL